MLEDDILNEPITNTPKTKVSTLLWVFAIALIFQLIVPFSLQLLPIQLEFNTFGWILFFCFLSLGSLWAAAIAIWQNNLHQPTIRLAAPLTKVIFCYALGSFLANIGEIIIQGKGNLIFSGTHPTSFIGETFTFYLYLKFFQNYFHPSQTGWKWIILLLSLLPAALINHYVMIFMEYLF